MQQFLNDVFSQTPEKRLIVTDRNLCSDTKVERKTWYTWTPEHWDHYVYQNIITISFDTSKVYNKYCLRLVSTKKFWKIESAVTLNYNCNSYKGIHLWNGNESRESNFDIKFCLRLWFLKKWQKVTFWY